MHYNFLFFDLDHTLLDFDAAEEVALTKLLEEYQVIDIKAYKDYYKPMNQNLWKQLEGGDISKADLVNSRFALLFAHFGVTVDGRQLAEGYQKHLKDQGQVYAGAKELLADLTAQGYNLYAATNGIATIQQGRLQASGLAPYFKAIFISEQSGSQKPKKAFYDWMTQQVSNYQPDQALMIGDSLSADVQGGINAGMDTLWYNPKHLLNNSPVHPTYEVSDYQALLNCIAE
ncbi:TPA: YjjG family noncanonical pyrimidine nucleotidase [Streptococcus pyogenes]|uniref:Noncanonical pyrimidine nucleotidase, YjjG family n=1 Tax=Streptococcus pyogenes TaxID=1314 RepID=A0ABD7UTZ6_STRPY|nr:YjjG family noncanonical pyrimidine nucleotidase [Streptococcus pyogenes]HEP6223137.1 YjjG family noncanonical pyrimidine nucleotidase [Streptococcus pyogenes ABC020014327]HEP6226386.1 YjjG family noncanonical pyrimidine nucleotidase [Streptococcus pyogenes ABC020056369]HEP6228237.1 YjjG family noncanonical pyrimidine nucleotidase [Streptococcus pyogenes ABC020013891]HEP6230014.1 YjjG family noncanonical pyrimidine nucleotidase [Streptococcus pyogenes ABC020041419]HEP6231675.1 YjjG family n